MTLRLLVAVPVCSRHIFDLCTSIETWKQKIPVGSWIGVFNLSIFSFWTCSPPQSLYGPHRSINLLMETVFNHSLNDQQTFFFVQELQLNFYMLHFTSLYFLYNIRYIYIIFSVENCKPVHRLHCVGKTLSFITYLGLIYNWMTVKKQ